jgi:hypothetical protein
VTGIYVVNADASEAKNSVAASISEQVARDKIIPNFSDTTYAELLQIERDTPGFYAWGVPPGPTNIMNWLYMATGDFVLMAIDGRYRYAAEVLGRYENAKAAQAIWNKGEAVDDSREYIFFLSRPASIDIPVKEMEDWLPTDFGEFTRIEDTELQAIRRDFGGVAKFLKENILQRSDKGPALDVSGIFKHVQDTATATGLFEAVSVTDSRTKHFEAIIRRRGHPRFRMALLRAYERRCAISKCGVRQVLEAALIRPYRGVATYNVSNGLLLRSDLHTLFDLGQISVDSSDMSVVISKKLENSSYKLLAGRKLFVPHRKEYRPSAEALDAHRMTWGL